MPLCHSRLHLLWERAIFSPFSSSSVAFFCNIDEILIFSDAWGGSLGGLFGIGEAASKGDTCGRHAGSAGVGVGREGLLLAAAGVTGDWLRCSLWGSHSQQHLLGPHQHPLTPVWQFHSCGGTAAADGFVPASTAVAAKLAC